MSLETNIDKMCIELKKVSVVNLKVKNAIFILFLELEREGVNQEIIERHKAKIKKLYKECE